MKFIISETGWDYLERLMYRGCIGLFYETTLQGMLAYIIFGLLMLFAIIGIISTVKFFFGKSSTGRNIETPLAINMHTINTNFLPPVMAAFLFIRGANLLRVQQGKPTADNPEAEAANCNKAIVFSHYRNQRFLHQNVSCLRI